MSNRIEERIKTRSQRKDNLKKKTRNAKKNKKTQQTENPKNIVSRWIKPTGQALPV